MDKRGLHEECGVFGIYSAGDINDIAHEVYYGLYALQHRGQQSCGIAVSDRGVVDCYKEMGLVGEVFDDEKLSHLKGQMAIGHVRYSKASESNNENSQPLVLRYSKGRIAIAHNGSLINAEEIRNELSHDGAMFQTQTDAELIAHIIAHERLKVHSVVDAVISAMKKLNGAYSILVMSPQKLVAARDPMGFRPLVLGKKGDSYVFVSETTALDAISAEYVRDIEPGEVVVVDSEGLRSYKDNCTGKRGICIFEYIYFARPDSTIDGITVHDARLKAGEILARRHPADADMVIGVPDSGLDAAIGYAKESGLPYGTGFVRNNYIGRTFIKPKQSERRKSIDIKLHVIEENVAGKKIVMVDDSIVRGSTCANIIRELKEAGAAEVHVRIASPTIHWPCYYGTDIPTREELTANHNTVEELCEIIGADSLGFLANEDLFELMQTKEKTFCDACFTGNYPTKID